jgi:hypothetical protein
MAHRIRWESVGRGQSAVVVLWLYSDVVVEMLSVEVEVTSIAESPVSVDVIEMVRVGRRTSEQRDV